MCTLTFIRDTDGYALAMNRDERIARGRATQPSRVDVCGVQAIYPRDVEGGTWIAASDRGVAFALLNWNDVPADTKKIRSRGEVIPALAGSTSCREAQAAAERLVLKGTLPFRLVGIFPVEKQIGEWRWDQTSLQHQALSWDNRHWFSSSLSDEQAALQRGAACERAWELEDAGSLDWLRRLHASHDPAPGPFSVCVHREGVETLSYTEVVCIRGVVRCTYFGGNPCTMQSPEYSIELERAASSNR